MGTCITCTCMHFRLQTVTQTHRQVEGTVSASVLCRQAAQGERGTHSAVLLTFSRLVLRLKWSRVAMPMHPVTPVAVAPLILHRPGPAMVPVPVIAPAGCVTAQHQQQQAQLAAHAAAAAQHAVPHFPPQCPTGRMSLPLSRPLRWLHLPLPLPPMPQSEGAKLHRIPTTSPTITPTPSPSPSPSPLMTREPG